MSRQKARERSWIEQFCCLAHLCVQEIECDDAQESPDAFVVLRRERECVRVGVEVTEYHSGVSGKKGSSARELHSNWDRIRGSLRCRARDHPQLRGVNVTLRLRRPARLPAGRAAAGLVKKLVALVASMVPQGPWRKVRERAPFTRPYESVGAYVREIALTRIGVGDWLHWDLPNAGWFGVAREDVERILRGKEDSPYGWGDAQERWLLIVAGSEPEVVATWGEPEPAYLPDTTGLGSHVFHRVLLLEATFKYTRELYCAPKLPPLTAT